MSWAGFDQFDINLLLVSTHFSLISFKKNHVAFSFMFFGQIPLWTFKIKLPFLTTCYVISFNVLVSFVTFLLSFIGVSSASLIKVSNSFIIEISNIQPSLETRWTSVLPYYSSHINSSHRRWVMCLVSSSSLIYHPHFSLINLKVSHDKTCSGIPKTLTHLGSVFFVVNFEHATRDHHYITFNF